MKDLILSLFRTNKKPFNAADVYHTSSVKRWHQTNVQRPQNLAEHSYTVTMFARMLLDVINPDANAEETLLLNDYALWHDMPEIVTGDPATPFKRLLEKIFKEVSDTDDNIFELVEKEICPQYAVLSERISGTYLARIVKLADILDAAKYISLEGKGEQGEKIAIERKSAFYKLVDICRKEYPQYQWDNARIILEDLFNNEPISIDFVETF